MKFQCSACGACCRRAGTHGLMPDRGDGACIYLGQNNLCTIYETRPTLCNVEAMFSVRKEQEPSLTLKQHYVRNNELCNKWIKEDGLDSSYLIDLSKYDKDGKEEISEPRRGIERRGEEALQEGSKRQSEASSIQGASEEITQESKEKKKLLCEDGRDEKEKNKLKDSE